MLGAAVFDLDGLLVDSEPLWHRAEIEVFGRYGVQLTPELCRTTKGMFVTEAARHWHGLHPWPGPSPEEVAAEIVDAMAGLLAGESAMLPGVHHALAFCRARLPLVAVASSSPRRLIDVALGRLGLTGSFDVVHSAEDEPAGKPHPAVFLSAAALLEVPPWRCVVFEDSPAGLAAARAAGMRCVVVPERRGVADGTFGAADVVLRSLQELDDDAWRVLESRVAASPG